MRQNPDAKERIINEFTELLPMLRARLGMTQEELANRIGATRQTIISVENKKRPLVWSMFLSMLFLFVINPNTRPFLVTAKVINTELSKIVFDDTYMLTQAVSMLDSEKPMLVHAQEMMNGMMKKEDN